MGCNADQDLFGYPGFSWSSAGNWGTAPPPFPPPQRIGGDSPHECQTVAWLLQLEQGFMKRDELFYMQREMAYATHLRRCQTKTTQIYNYLAQLGDTCCDLTDLERRLGDYWGRIRAQIASKTGSVEKLRDPYHWKRVVDIVQASMEDFLTQLDMALCGMHGLSPDQSTAHAYNDFYIVRKGVQAELSKAILDRTRPDLKVATERLFSLYAPERLAKARRRFDRIVKATSSLMRLTNASPDKGAMLDVLHNSSTDIRTAALDPPPEFVEELGRAGVSVAELNYAFRAEACGAVRPDDGPSAPTLQKTRYDILFHFIHRVAGPLHQACASTISIYKRLHGASIQSEEFSGVHVAGIHDPLVKAVLDTQAQRGEFHRAEPCPLPSHAATFGKERPVLYVPYTTNTGAHGLRAIRFLDTLRKMATAGYLLPFAVRASALLPIFAEIQSDVTNSYAQIIGNAKRLGYPPHPPRERKVPRCAVSPFVSPPSPMPIDEPEEPDARAVVVPPPSPLLQPTRVSILKPTVASGVADSLKRSHAILAAVGHALDFESTMHHLEYINISTIADHFIRITKHDDTLNKGQRSVEQACAHTLTSNIIPYYMTDMQQQGVEVGHVVYEKFVRGKTEKGGHPARLVVDTVGARQLRNYCCNWGEFMQNEGDTAVKVWHTSRSSRAHAALLARKGHKRNASLSGDKPTAQK